MKKYEFNPINCIAQTFDERQVKYLVVNYGCQEELMIGFSIDLGPNVLLRFITKDNDNDIAIRIFGLVTSVPIEKRPVFWKHVIC